MSAFELQQLAHDESCPICDGKAKVDCKICIGRLKRESEAPVSAV
jgi:hypothetical protein